MFENRLYQHLTQMGLVLLSFVPRQFIHISLHLLAVFHRSHKSHAYSMHFDEQEIDLVLMASCIIALLIHTF